MTAASGIGRSDRARWFGLKPLLRCVLLLRPVNALYLLVARPLASWLPALRRVPPAVREVGYRLECGKVVVLCEPRLCDVAKDVYWGRGRRTDPRDALVMEVFESLVDRNSLMLDVGSYTGLFAQVACARSPTIEAHAFEILPEAFRLLERNVARNGFAARCQTHLLGLSDAPGQLIVPHAARGSVLPSSFSLASAAAGGTPVAVSTLDASFGPDERRPTLIKVDVEGFEAEVIAGGASFIARTLPDVVCEVLPRSAGSARITAALRPLGYRFFLFTQRGLREQAQILPSSDGRDWLFTARGLPVGVHGGDVA